MSKEIKFRAWYGMSMREFILLPNINNIINLTNINKIMQFTGLQDKNGKDIFEGDIVKVNALYDKVEGEVVFHECSWCFKVPISNFHETPFRKIGTGWYGIKVIGNIYENPELIHEVIIT